VLPDLDQSIVFDERISLFNLVTLDAEVYELAMNSRHSRLSSRLSFTGYILSSVVDAQPLRAGVECVEYAECKFVICGPAARKPLEGFD
jgi:hypothetical protein